MSRSAVAVVLLAALAATSALAAALPHTQAHAATALPPPATVLQQRLPWEISREEQPHLPWEGLQNNLTALLQVQARDRDVAIIVFNEGFAELALNCLVSLVKFGNSPNYIITSVGASSLAYCRELRLPCYDGVNLLSNVTLTGDEGLLRDKGALSTDADSKRYSTEWFHLVWIKTLIAHAVNSQGYNILFAGERSLGSRGSEQRALVSFETW